MADDDLRIFAEAIAGQKLTETQEAIAILWFHDHYNRGVELTFKAIAQELIDQGLRKNVNVARLGYNLLRNDATAKGSQENRLKLGPKRRQFLDEEYAPLLRAPKVIVQDKFLPDSIIQGTRPYLEKLAWQINGCFQHEFYVGCAVICRRMVEGLLIESFKVAGHDDKIRDPTDNNYYMLNKLITIATSGQYLKLPRTAPAALETVKKIGDTAAHHPTHITTKPDIDKLGTEFRQLVSELLHLANIQKK